MPSPLRSCFLLPVWFCLCSMWLLFLWDGHTQEILLQATLGGGSWTSHPCSVFPLPACPPIGSVQPLLFLYVKALGAAARPPPFIYLVSHVILRQHPLAMTLPTREVPPSSIVAQNVNATSQTTIPPALLSHITAEVTRVVAASLAAISAPSTSTAVIQWQQNSNCHCGSHTVHTMQDVLRHKTHKDFKRRLYSLWSVSRTSNTTNDQRFHLKWLDSTTARVCYGCGGKLRPDASSIPPAPFDFVITTKEYRSWHDKNTETTRITTKPEATHNHVNPVCIYTKNPGFTPSENLRISAEDRGRMVDIHRDFLMCGKKCLFHELLQFSLAPPFPPPMQCWTTRRRAFPYEQHCMGGRGESRIWPKERWFPCEKLIDGRGSAFCKLVPHNFGQDCLNVEIKHKSACNFHINQRMDVKFDMVNVRDLLHMFHPNLRKNLNVLVSCMNVF